MISGRITGASLNLGAPEDWDEDTNGPCQTITARQVYHGDTPFLETAWYPTGAELQQLLAGQPLILSINCISHPVVSLHMGDFAAATNPS